MIESFRDKWLEDFFRSNIMGKQVPADLTASLFRRLQMLDDAACDKDLRSPPSNHFEKLCPPLESRCSIRVNRKWRLIFIFDDGKASDVYLDPHD